MRLEKIILKCAHLPTLLLMVGYPVFWLELYAFNRGTGQTSFLATGIFLILSLGYLRRDTQAESPFLNEPAVKKFEGNTKAKFFLGLSILISLFIVLIVFYAALYPPHLMQEFDAIQYHITLPRQHLIRGSFQFIPWAADDLFVLPIQFAMAPYWLATTLPNKLPQFICFLGIIFVSINLVNYFRVNKTWNAWIIVFAIVGSHHIGIQMGTAMLDLVVCYLFLAALDSVLRGNVLMASVELAFFFWAKSAIPLQMTLLAIILLPAFFIFKKMGWRIKLGFNQYPDSALKARYWQTFRKALMGFFLLSFFVAGPFLAKSTYNSGTPLFPFLPGIVSAKFINKNIDHNSRAWKSLLGSSQSWTGPEGRNHAGFGKNRTLLNFLKHFWLIAVPEESVNNRFDYPVGLMYLIFMAPFIYLIFGDFRKKELGAIPVFIAAYWLMWWIGVQETRHLYIPTLLIFLVVLPELRNYSSVFFSVVLIALMLNAISIFRAHKKDLGLPVQEVLREKDLEILKMNRDYIKEKRRDEVDMDFHDVAFAQFPVRVTKEKLPHTLAL